MEDKELIKIYSIGMFMLALLDEWSKLERIGSVAKIHNVITKKHSNFHSQIHDVESGKKKKCSHKCNLFIHASALSIVAWKESAMSTGDIKMSANTVLHNLYRLNREGLNRIYGLNEDLFRALDKTNEDGVSFMSCRVARIMSENIEKIISDKIDDISDNIYQKKDVG